MPSLDTFFIATKYTDYTKTKGQNYWSNLPLQYLLSLYKDCLNKWVLDKVEKTNNKPRSFRYRWLVDSCTPYVSVFSVLLILHTTKKDDYYFNDDTMKIPSLTNLQCEVHLGNDYSWQHFLRKLFSVSVYSLPLKSKEINNLPHVFKNLRNRCCLRWQLVYTSIYPNTVNITATNSEKWKRQVDKTSSKLHGNAEFSTSLQFWV